jgi:hypothetical protein
MNDGVDPEMPSAWTLWPAKTAGFIESGQPGATARKMASGTGRIRTPQRQVAAIFA